MFARGEPFPQKEPSNEQRTFLLKNHKGFIESEELGLRVPSKGFSFTAGRFGYKKLGPNQVKVLLGPLGKGTEPLYVLGKPGPSSRVSNTEDYITTEVGSFCEDLINQIVLEEYEGSEPTNHEEALAKARAEKRPME